MPNTAVTAVAYKGTFCSNFLMSVRLLIQHMNCYENYYCLGTNVTLLFTSLFSPLSLF